MASTSGGGTSSSSETPVPDVAPAELACPVCAALVSESPWIPSGRWARVRSEEDDSCFVVAPKVHAAVLDNSDWEELSQLVEAARASTGCQTTFAPLWADDHGHVCFAIRVMSRETHPSLDSRVNTDKVTVPATDLYATVRLVLGLLRRCQRLSLYRPAVRVWARNENTNRRRAQVAPIYVLACSIVLLSLLFSSELWADNRKFELLAVAIGAYRMVDIVSFHSLLLLSRSATDNTVAGYERNLILLGGNLMEISLICAIWFRAAGSPTALEAWYNGFLTATLVSAPAASQSLAGPPAETAVPAVLTVAAAIVLLLGGLSTLLSLIGRKFGEYGG